MKAVVDTNVVAYYLFGTEPFIEHVRQFRRTVEEVYARAIGKPSWPTPSGWLFGRAYCRPRKGTGNSIWRRASESSRLQIDRGGNRR